MSEISGIICLMKKLDEVLKALHSLEIKVLLAFKKKEEFIMEEIIEIAKLSEGDSRRAIGWLITKKLIEIKSKISYQLVSLTELGKQYLKEGVPEVRIMNILKEKGKIKLSELNIPDCSQAIGTLKRGGLIKIKEGGIIERGENLYVDFTTSLMKKISERGKVSLSELPDKEQELIETHHRKRGRERGIFRVDEREKFTYRIIDNGKEILKSLKKRKEKISQLTPELLKDGSWREKEFREYNIELRPPRIVAGKLHPYQEFLNIVREKLISMGFCEVSGELVESEFWNMDVLFMPQQHPARDVHGIYFVKSPKYTEKIESKLLDKVSKTHQNGWLTGSKGWGYKFDKKRARQLILRSQGTVLSVRTLAQHPEPPGKYFAIARCFRPDVVDATHTPEFFQIEGIVVSKDVNLRTLLGLLKLFGTEIADAKEIKFTPGYFPFTEPSVELHAKHPKLGWIELGGAGIFRPEVTLPLGVKVPVIAWGLGLDRMAMMALNIQDIRNLFSRDLEFLRKITF